LGAGAISAGFKVGAVSVRSLVIAGAGAMTEFISTPLRV
jgi:hypothetical protein